ncbi:MAG: sugar phosphate nucleotidyltransferase [Myxococcota bacterium]
MIVLAAGFGTRLWPLTADRAKPAVPFLGQPLIAGLVDRLAKAGFERVVVNTHHQPASIRSALAGREVQFSHETEILGTAGGPAQARDLGLLDPNDDVLIVNGKLYTEIDFGAVMAAHRASGAAVTMVLRSNAQRAHFREVLVDGGQITGFGQGRIPSGPDPLLFTGVHVVSSSVLQTMMPVFSDTIRDVYPPLIEAGEVSAHLADQGRWWEFSTPERYWALHQQAATEGWGQDVVADPSAERHSSAHVSQAVLWSGVRIDANARVERSILCEGVFIKAGEQVKDSVVVRKDRLQDPERGQAWGDRIRIPLDATLSGALRS